MLDCTNKCLKKKTYLRVLDRKKLILLQQKLNESECKFRPQCQFGMEYMDEDFIIFRAQMLDLQTVVSFFLSSNSTLQRIFIFIF